MIEHDGVTYEWDEHDMLVPVPAETTRVVNGRTYKVTTLTCEYDPKPQVIAGVSKIRAWAGRTDATMIPADHA